MDDSSYKLNLDLGKKNKIHHHSWKEHVKMSKIAKFGRETGLKWCIFPCVIQINTKFANFVGLYFSFYNISQPNFAILLILRCSI